jgi:REP element-mobilizing transposase RayT
MQLIERGERRNRVNIHLHFVWTTWDRQPFLLEHYRRPLYRCIAKACRELDCEVLAIGGVSDHVHLAVSVPTDVTPAQIMQFAKGRSSRFMNDPGRHGGAFRWREGYGVFSFSPSHKQAVLKYIQNQEQHHADGTLWPHVENPDDD